MIAKQPRHAKVSLRMSGALLVLGAVLFASSPSQARDMTGKGGVGLLVTTEGMPMAAFRYWRTSYALEALVGYVSATPVPARVTRPDTTQVRVSLGFLYRIGDAPKASLAIGLRPWVEYTLVSYSVFYRPNGQTPTQVDDGNWRFGTEIPLHGEVFLNDHFSLIGHVGLNVDFGSPVARLSGTATALDQQKDASLFIGVRGGFAGGVGATYYF